MWSFLKIKKIVPAGLLAGVLSFLVWAFFPLTDNRWDLTRHGEKARKEDLLRRLPVSSGSRPNVVILLADDLGKMDLTLYGGRRLATPHLDALAAEGLLFKDATCTSPICAPSRAALLTGRYQQRGGFETQPMSRYPANRLEYFVYKNFILRTSPEWVPAPLGPTPAGDAIRKQGVAVDEPILPEILGRSGYATAIIGKWHLGENTGTLPEERGFQYQYGCYEAFTLFGESGDPGLVESRHDYFADKHIWSKGRSGSSAIRRNGKEIFEKEYLTDAIAREATAFITSNRAKPFFLYVPFTAPHTPFQAKREIWERFSGETNHNVRVYLAMIASLDEAVGNILASLKENRLDENTIVIFAGDNGGAAYTGACDNAPMKGGKFTLFEGGLGIPMMLRWTGKVRPGVVPHPVSLLDVAPTILETVGVKPLADHPWDGKNLLAEGAETTDKIRKLFWRSGYNRAIRIGEWKLISMGRDQKDLLYNLTSDPGESKNLSELRPDLVKTLKEEIHAWEKDMAPPRWPHVMDYRVKLDGDTWHFAL